MALDGEFDFDGDDVFNFGEGGEGNFDDDDTNKEGKSMFHRPSHNFWLYCFLPLPCFLSFPC